MGLFFSNDGGEVAAAVIDPWLYREYADGRRLFPDYRNFEAGREFFQWLLRQN